MDVDLPVESARRARKWGRPVTDDEADALLAELDAARATIAELDAAGWLHDPAYVAALEAEVERLRPVVAAARDLFAADDPYGEVREGTTWLDRLSDRVEWLDRLAAAAETGSGEACS